MLHSLGASLDQGMLHSLGASLDQGNHVGATREPRFSMAARRIPRNAANGARRKAIAVRLAQHRDACRAHQRRPLTLWPMRSGPRPSTCPDEFVGSRAAAPKSKKQKLV
jgi:hypothetical protein